jgi:hypothetical protein
MTVIAIVLQRSGPAGAGTPTGPVTRWSQPPNDKHPIRRTRVENPAAPWRSHPEDVPRRRCVSPRPTRLAHRTLRPARVGDDRRLPAALRRLAAIVRRDVALLREAGFYLETIAANQYPMLCFDRDSDAP